MFSTVIIFVLLLSALVFVHEFGHFIVAVKTGMRVEEFGFGFPPKAWGIKRGKTVYSINWIPLGGFVRIKGESGEHAHDKDSFGGRPLWARMLVVLAGVTMNVVFAWALLTVGYLVGLPSIIETRAPQSIVTEAKLNVYDVVAGSPAELAGIKQGDAIITVDGQPMTSIEAMIAYTSAREGQTLHLQLERAKKSLSIDAVPVQMSEAGHAGLGLKLFETGFVSYPWYLAPWEGAKATASFLSQIVVALYGFFRDLVVTRTVSQDMSGPVGIAVLTGEVAALGGRYLLQFAALLSLNLAVVNVLPLPALDGGRFVFVLAEMLRRRPVNAKFEAITHSVGFAALMLVVVLVTYRDLVKYGGKILENLSGLVGR
jgi:regulator of sigma E protease